MHQIGFFSYLICSEVFFYIDPHFSNHDQGIFFDKLVFLEKNILIAWRFYENWISCSRNYKEKV